MEEKLAGSFTKEPLAADYVRAAPLLELSV